MARGDGNQPMAGYGGAGVVEGGRRFRRHTPGCYRAGNPESGVTHAKEADHQPVDQRQPRGVDDVLVDTDAAPGVGTVAVLYQHPYPGGRAVARVEVAHPVVGEPHPVDLGVAGPQPGP